MSKEKMFFTTRGMNFRTIYIYGYSFTIRQPSLFRQIPNTYGGHDHIPSKYHCFLTAIGIK
jgi:hypothetical protein